MKINQFLLVSLITPVLGFPVSSGADTIDLIKENSAEQSAKAIELEGLIFRGPLLQETNQQADSAIKDGSLPEIRLWPHVFNEEQKHYTENILNILDTVGFEYTQRTIDIQNTQVLETVPMRSQLRIFKSADLNTAKSIISFFEENGLPLEIVDLTQKYKDQKWIQIGHMELWLGQETPVN